MAATETPPTRPDAGANGTEIEEVPTLLVQLQDDLARSRMREAFWMSLFFHMVILILLATSTKWMPDWGGTPVIVATPQELIQQRELTYLDLPPDLQKTHKRPDTNVISDKDRIASRRPTLDRKELQKILDSARPGTPGARVPPPAPAAQMAQHPGTQMQNPATQQGPAQPQQNQMAKMEGPKLEPPRQTQPTGGIFGGAVSPGRALAEASRAAASRPGAGYGMGGDYGLGVGGSQGKVQDGLEIVSDTMGVDFGPYLARVLHDVRLNWYNLIPDAARAPLMKRGKVAIEFAILKNGAVGGMKLTSGSGDVSLDRAAWGGITASNPFPPLPGEFRGNYLALRFHFFYNPDKSDLR